MLSVSQFAQVNKRFAEFNRCRTLLETLERKKEVLEDLLLPHHHQRYLDVTVDLKIHRSRLDNTQFIYNTPKWLGWPVKDVVNYVFEGVNFDRKAKPTPLEQEAIELMHDLGRQARASGHKFAIQSEMAYRASQGWFFLFNTLTVRDGCISQVFNERSRAFVDYIRDFDASIRKEITGARRNKPESDYHSYCAVTEIGPKTGRLHVHVLHAFSHLPMGVSCPNVGLPSPINRELPYFRQFWRYGYSVPLGVRYSSNDAYGRAGFRWPLDPATGKGLVSKSPLAISGYMSKYIAKAYNSQKRNDYKWRVKKSRNLGTKIPELLVNELSLKTLQTMIWTNQITATINQSQIPKAVLRKAVLQRLQNIHGSQNQFDQLKGIPTQAGLLTQLRALTQESPMFSPSKPTNFNVPDLTSEDIYEAQIDLNQAAYKIDCEYFQRSFYDGKANSSRAH